nr:myb-like domain, Myb/SANT-like DNA-binding domain protein [Tanacetum cinerariifolium]
MSKKSKGKEAESTGDVTLRWSSDEEALLAECYVAVSEDRNVGRSQAKDTFWVRVMHEFNRKNFQKRTKDMLTSKWTTLNHHCQKFNAIYKRCHCLKKSGENEVDLMGRARVMYQDERRNSLFNHDKAWAILRQHAKWDAPEVAPVELTEDETGDFHATVNTDELFGADPRPRPPANNAPEKNQIRHIGEHRGKSIVPIWKKKFMLKADFEKAFDTLNSSFLDSMLSQMGFSHKWRKWIHSCLDSAFSSVLVNGSPTSEDCCDGRAIARGLRRKSGSSDCRLLSKRSLSGDVLKGWNCKLSLFMEFCCKSTKDGFRTSD